MYYKYNIGDKVKLYDNDHQVLREVIIIGFDEGVDYPSYIVKEYLSEVTWYLDQDSIKA